MSLYFPGIKARGHVRLVLRDIITGSVSELSYRNTITESGLSLLKNWFLSTYSSSSYERRLMTHLRLVGPEAYAQLTSSTDHNREKPYRRTYIFVFAPGVGTGVITELQGRVSGSVNTELILSEPITKLPNHELTVEWTVYLDFAERVVSKVLSGAQKDGVTDIEVTTYIPDSYARSLIFTTGMNGYDSPRLRVRAGTSNDPSDIETDPTGLKGNSLGTEKIVSIVQGDVRPLRVALAEWNGEIGELYVEHLPVNSTGGFKPFCRFTFDPPLDKTSDYELELTWTYDAVEVPPP